MPKQIYSTKSNDVFNYNPTLAQEPGFVVFDCDGTPPDKIEDFTRFLVEQQAARMGTTGVTVGAKAEVEPEREPEPEVEPEPAATKKRGLDLSGK